MIELARSYPDEAVAKPKPDLRSVLEAANLVGVHEMTVWRYLRLGYLKRHKNAPGLPRGTRVDVNELRRLRENPPTEPAE
jgi:hypothetical protein